MTPFDSKQQARTYKYRTMQTERLKRLLERNTENNEIIKKVLKEREEEEEGLKGLRATLQRDKAKKREGEEHGQQ